MRIKPRILTFAAVAFTWVSPGSAFAAPAELTPPVDSRIKLLMYDENDVYTITAKYGYQTNVVFSPSEEIQTISVGDRSLWQIIPAGNRMFIRPMSQDVITNMTILTNKRSYQFDLKAVPEDKEGANIYVAKFVYPEDIRHIHEPEFLSAPTEKEAPVQPVDLKTAPAATEGSATPAAAAPIAPPSAPLASAGAGITHPVNPNYNYTYTGPDELAPTQVYDDGKTTYFKYRAVNQSLPNIYVIEADGREQPVTRYVRGDAMAVDIVAAKFALKNSNGTILIFNEMLNPL